MLLSKKEITNVELSATEKKFIDIAADHEQMQNCQDELEPLLRYSTTSFAFEKSKMVGFIKKFTQQTKIVGRNSHLRCIIIDFKSAILVIKHDKDTTDTSKIKKIMFRDVIGVAGKEDKSRDFEEYSYRFSVKTTEREYVFSARTQYERKIWMAGFKYMLIMTAIMQNIIRS